MGLSATAAVRIAWDANPEADIAGYRVYFGTTIDSRTNVVEAGNQTSAIISELSFDNRFFCHVTAYNVFGLESDPSEVLSFEPLSLSLEANLIALAPSQATLRPTLTGDPRPGSNLTFSWQQLGGPEWLTVAGLTTLTPTLQLRTPGYYTLRLTVTDGATSHVRTTAVQVLDATPPAAGSEPIALTYFYVPPDGLLLSWNSEPGASYLVGRQSDLDNHYWVNETESSAITSAGSLTDFVIGQDKLDGLKRGFFSIFRTP